MAHKGTSSSVRNASRKPTQKSKPKTTKKAAASSAQRKRKTVSSGSRSGSTKSASAKHSSTRSYSGTASGSGRRASAGKGTGRKSAGTAASTRRKTNAASSGRKSTAVQEPMNPKVQTDIIMTAALLFSVLLVMSNFGIGGAAGKLFASFFFGLFGLMAYVFPVILFLLTAFFIANRGHARRGGKFLCYILFFMFVCAFIHMLTKGYSSSDSLKSYYSSSSFDRSGGGLFGGIVVFLIGKAFGKYGCYVISVFGMIITLCFATQRPLISNAAERGILARERLQAMRERSLRRKDFLPYDEEEFDEYDGYDDEEDIEDDPDLEDEEILSLRGSARNSRYSSRTDRQRREQTSDFGYTIGEQQSFSDSFLYSLDRREKEEQSHKNNDTLEMDSQDLYDLFDPAEEAAQNSAAEKNKRKKSKGIFSSRMDTADSSGTGSLEALTINGSEGAAAMEATADHVEETASANEDTGRQRKKNPRSSAAEIAEGVESISEEMQEKEEQIKAIPYQLPPLEILKKGTGIPRGDSTKYLKETAGNLEKVLQDFGVNAHVVDVSCGPSVTRYEVKPEQGVKVSKIVNLADDIKLNLAASNIRIEAPIPGKAAVGIEVPNKNTAPVLLRDLLESPEFVNHPSRIAFAVGKDIAGKTVVTDIARMPHLLIAGATGSGKSVCINTLIMSILYKASPDEVKLLMIDPKVVELSVYNGIPHLSIPVVTDPKKAAGALNWAVAEMSDRYNKFAEYGVRDVAGYNAKVDSLTDVPEEQKPKKMPQIVIVVDELADLMMVAPGEVEDAICRLAQLARAAGIHLIIATQRPSVNVVTGLIKANMPSRIALSVASGVDSRTILDMNGAEKLLGHGDMLFYPSGYTQPARVQGGYISDEEIASVVKYLTEQHGEVTYDASIEAKINSSSSGGTAKAGGGSDQDELFIDAAKLIVDKEKASIGMLQRQFKIGFNRAARIMDQLCDAGVVGAEEGTKPRKVLLSKEQFENYLEEGRL
ncbi:MAG: DNA translocase FtsK 4TM domain-containing protein [Lachnospiraceae bacterium]|nr:DNA translocase FtsK 4TM domain-containing protein [Lachnospiraceae bacterium]